jgi:molybdopterin-dependent oxidoreductase alpha subunit
MAFRARKRGRGVTHDIDVHYDEHSAIATEVKQEAAGVRAVMVSLQRGLTSIGPFRTAASPVRLNQRKGFDCPGCAWPEEHGGREFAEFCENGAKAVAEEATKRVVTPEFFARHSIADLASRPEYWLSQLRSLDNPTEAVFYTSGRTSNEAAFLYQLMVRSFGTNNLPERSDMCHESSGHALIDANGIGKGSVTVDDVVHADLIVIAGQNPGTNHPRMLSVLEKAKANGAKIIAVNPLPEAGLIRFKDPQKVNGVVGKGMPIADEYVQIRLGGDMALFAGLGRLMLEADDLAPGTIVDRQFIAAHCANFEEWETQTRQVDIDTVLEATGIDRRQLERVAAMMMESDRTVVCRAMGLTQHRHAVPMISEILNVLLMRGMIGKPGAGVCPVRGHSNVQGDRTMGIWEQMPEKFLAALDGQLGIVSPREHRVDTVAAIRAMRDGSARFFMGMGGNFAFATPDTPVTEAALPNCSMTVQASTKLNYSHVVHGRTALILPSPGRTDRDLQDDTKQQVSVEDSMSMVHLSRGSLQPPSDQVRSEVAIICQLARTLLGPGHPVLWERFNNDYDSIRDAIAAVVPGCEDYNSKVRQADGFQLPHSPRGSYEFPTSTGKANFAVNPSEWEQVPLGRLVLQTLRSHDEYNTTIYGLDDRYRGVKGGRRVDLVSEFTDSDGQLQERCAKDSAYYAETNALVPLEHVAVKSNTPVSKAVVIRLEPAGQERSDSGSRPAWQERSDSGSRPAWAG